MCEINKLLYGQWHGLVRNFHTHCLCQKSHPLAALARSISDTYSPSSCENPVRAPGHEVISIFAIVKQMLKGLNLVFKKVHCGESIILVLNNFSFVKTMLFKTLCWNSLFLATLWMRANIFRFNQIEHQENWSWNLFWADGGVCFAILKAW